MAASPKLTVRVGQARSSSDISVTTTGVYAGTSVNTITFDLINQPVQPNASAKVFWTAVLTAVQAHLATL